MNIKTLIGITVGSLLIWLPAFSEATTSDKPCPLAVAETIYVPSFSHVLTHERTPQALASTLVIHNVDPAAAITVNVATHHDASGTLIKDLLPKPVQVAPYGSTNFLIDISDDRGGIGENFIVEWSSEEPVCSPLVFAVMVGGSGTHGISFSLDGRVISRDAAEQN